MTRSAIDRRNMIRQITATVLLALLAGAAAPGAQEGVITRSEALAAVYPDAAVTRDRVILTREQMGSVAALARVGMQGRIFPRYVARDEDGAVVGRAYIDTHTPKTERQSLLISLDTAGRVIRVRRHRLLRAGAVHGASGLAAAVRRGGAARRAGHPTRPSDPSPAPRSPGGPSATRSGASSPSTGCCRARRPSRSAQAQRPPLSSSGSTPIQGHSITLDRHCSLLAPGHFGERAAIRRHRNRICILPWPVALVTFEDSREGGDITSGASQVCMVSAYTDRAIWI